MSQPSLSGSFGRVKHYLPDQFRSFVEDNYYKQVCEKSILENICDDYEFIKNPVEHIAFYSDHGPNHAKNVSKQILQVFDKVHGIHIPKRDGVRAEFIKGYGIALAYLHDIGMSVISTYGRKMHPEFAAQEVFTPKFNEMIDLFWEHNTANIPWRIVHLQSKKLFTVEPKVILRELLSLSFLHNKTKFPVHILNDRQKVYQTSLSTVQKNIYFQYLEQTIYTIRSSYDEAKHKNEKPEIRISLKEQLRTAEENYNHYLRSVSLQRRTNANFGRYYFKNEKAAYQWILSDMKEAMEFTEDIIDAIRILRAADALWPRGVPYKTSGGYEIFADQKSANAIYTLQSSDNSKVFLLEAFSPINAGEANLSGCELDMNSNLRFAFKKGNFFTPQATYKAAFFAAFVIDDIYQDVVKSFDTKNFEYSETYSLRDYYDIKIIIENLHDNKDFAQLIIDEFAKLNPNFESECQIVPSLQNADLNEVNRYLLSKDFIKNDSLKNEILRNIAHHGYKTQFIDRKIAFEHVKIIQVKEGDRLIRSGSPSGFVYVPFEDGLQVIQYGEYRSISVQAWFPVGNIGVIQKKERNADIFAGKTMKLIMIPAEIYLKHWYSYYAPDEIRDIIDKMNIDRDKNFNSPYKIDY